MFTCSNCGKAWADNHCPECFLTIDCQGNFLVSQAEVGNPSGFRTTVSTHGGVTIGRLYCDGDGLVLRRGLSLAIGALLFLISWIGTLLLLFTCQAMFFGAGNHPTATAVCSLVAMVAGVLVPCLIAWRVRRFEQRFPMAEIVQVHLDLTKVEIAIRPHDAAPVNLEFFPFHAEQTTAIGRMFKSLGVAVHERGVAERAEFLDRLNRATPSTWVTPTLVGINALVFLLMCIVDNEADFNPSIKTLVRWGADFGPLTVTGQQWWRLLAACFVHIGILHLLFNMVALWQAGRIVEKLLGNWFYLAVYFGCGVVGCLTSLYFQPNLVSAGASGAIFGIYGALFGIIIRQRETLPREMTANLLKFGGAFFAYNIYGSLQTVFASALHAAQGPHIDLACHAGGLVSGLFFGFVSARTLERERRQTATTRCAVSLAGATVALAALLFFPVQKFGKNNLTNFKALGGMYFNGEGVAKDQAAGLHWFVAAAEQGDLASQKALGAAYYRGEGVETNIAEAVHWFTKAGEQNDSSAAKFLAGVYFSGQGVPTNNLEGVKWLTKVAEQGADQDFNDLEKAVALAYYHGNGLPQNVDEAVKWLTKVADRGDSDAKAMLKAMRERPSASIEKGLSADQVKINSVQNSFDQIYKKHVRALHGLVTALDQASRVETVLTRERMQLRLASLEQVANQLAVERQFFLNQPAEIERMLTAKEVDPTVITVVARNLKERNRTEAAILTDLFEAVADYREKITVLLKEMDQYWDDWKAVPSSTQIQFKSAAAKTAYQSAGLPMVQSAQSVRRAFQVWENKKNTP